MDTTTVPPRARLRNSRLSTERAELRGAVAMVASAAATRVTVSGLRFHERLLPEARRLAAEAGVLLIEDQRPDGHCIIVAARSS